MVCLPNKHWPSHKGGCCLLADPQQVRTPSTFFTSLPALATVATNKLLTLAAGVCGTGIAILGTCGGVLASEAPTQNGLRWELETTPLSSSPSDDGSEAPQASSLVWELDFEPLTATSDPNTAPAGPETTGNPVNNGKDTEKTSPGSPPLVGIPLLEPFPAPNLNGGLPSGYVANWGDYFVSASAGTPGKQRDGAWDGSLNLGFGLGDAYRWLAVEVDWNIGSTRNFNANGSFSVLASRMLVNEPRLQVVLGGGLEGLFAYGNESKQPSAGFGVLTLATPLRTPNPYFNQVLQISAGYGGRDFAPLDENFNGPEESFFAALGLEITSNVGLSLGWSGRGANVNLSYTPSRDLPFTVNLLAADVFNVSPFGTVGVLTVSWGDTFRTGLF